jgi:hypothetical protein
MQLSAVLVVFMLSSQDERAAAASFERAALEVLGSSAVVRVETESEDVADEYLVEQAGEADGVVELTFSADRSEVLLHCYLSGQERWIDRSITFGPEDPDEERGRLLGFVVASMFQSNVAKAPLEEPEVAPLVTLGETVSVGPDPASIPMLNLRDKTEPEPAARSGLSVELAGINSIGLGGNADGLGAGAAFRVQLREAFWLRIALGGRAGTIREARADTTTALASVGSVWAVPLNAYAELLLRGEAIGSWFQVAREPSDTSGTEERGRWLLGVGSAGTVAYRLAPSAAAFFGLGLEAMLGSTDIYMQGQKVATVPWLRAVGELGLRADF